VIETTVRCDVCQIQKQQTNRWWVVAIQGKGIFTIRDAHRTRPANGVDVCGQNCAHTLFDRWMTTGSLNKPETTQ
jgi:hypothetical protein